MSASNRLSTAVKALCYLAKVFPEPKNSSEIAKEIGVNASKLRQILSTLNKNEIVSSLKGTQGGFVLKQDFTSLTLHEIYSALEDRKIMEFDVADASNASSQDTENYNKYFNHLFWDIQKQIEKRMQHIKLVDIKEDAENLLEKE